MPELFDNEPEESAFELPGDAERLAINGDAAEPVSDDSEQNEPGAPAATAPTGDDPAGDEAAAGGESGETGEVETDPRVVDYLAKYDGDVTKALEAAASAQSVIGRQGQELGELRKLVERVGSLEETVKVATQPHYDPEQLEAFFAENPARIPEIAQQAFYQGNDALMDAAIDAWEDVDRGAARRFGRDVATARAQNAVRAETQQTAEVNAGWAEAAEQFAAAHPDLEEHAPRMREIATNFPKIVQILQTGDAPTRVEVLEFLYQRARGHVSDTLAEANGRIGREQAQEAAKAIQEATVASAATARTAQTANVAERIAAEWDAADAALNDGWNI